MSPLRWDVLGVGFVLALPVLALGLRGDFSPEEMTSRLPWCLLAGWALVALFHYVTRPRAHAPAKHPAARPPAEHAEDDVAAP